VHLFLGRLRYRVFSGWLAQTLFCRVCAFGKTVSRTRLQDPLRVHEGGPRRRWRLIIFRQPGTQPVSRSGLQLGYQHQDPRWARVHPVAMEYVTDKVDEMVLALLYLTTFDDRPGYRAWKSHDWNALDPLHAKGYIGDPKSKSKSVVVTEAGAERSRELFEKHLGGV
jgi:hypothetical protein